MKKILIISLFVLGLIIPNINVKAVDVSNEEELRAAIEQGGDITLTGDIEIKESLVIDKDVNISGGYILMQGDNTLITVNSGNVTFIGVNLYAGWNGEYYDGAYPDNMVKGQGKALVVNGGTVNFIGTSQLFAGNVGLEVNDGIVTGGPRIKAGEYNDNDTFSGGKGMIVNGGNIDLDYLYISSGETALTLNKGSNITLNNENGTNEIYSYEGNGIEVNDGSLVNIISPPIYSSPIIFGSQNAIYLNGGTANLSELVDLSSSSAGYGIYINKGINTSTKGDVLNLKNDFVFGYEEGTTPNFSIYVNPDITELKVTDEKGFLELLNNKLNLGFCSNTNVWVESQTEEERKAICTNLNSNYDGPIESNELKSCTVVYINGNKNVVDEENCNVQIDNNEENNNPQVVEVPSTSAYASIIIATLGIICVIVSVFVMRKMTNKA